MSCKRLASTLCWGFAVLFVMTVGCADESAHWPPPPTDLRASEPTGGTTPAAQPGPAGPVAERLWVGFARQDITPPRSMSLMGYGYRMQEVSPGNLGVRDPLYVRAMVLDNGGEPACILALDLCLLGRLEVAELRAIAAKKMGGEPQRVLICPSHTHSGPMALSPENVKRWKQREHRESPQTKLAVQYYARLKQAVSDAVADASAQKYPMRAYVQEAPLGIAYDRRVAQPDGTVKHCWSPQVFPHRPPGLAVDPTCTLLQFRQVVGPRSLLVWSFGCHPVTLGRTSRLVSADYPGAANAKIEASVPASKAMFVQAASGHAQPWLATQEDADAVQAVGETAGAFVSLLSAGTREVVPGGVPRLQVASRTVTIGEHKLDISIWRLGELWIAACPVELFGELALQLRQQLDGPVLLMTVANGAAGYWPDKASFPAGGYEIEAAEHGQVLPGQGEKLIAEMVRLAGTLTAPAESE